jgi:uncharacterized protein YjiK
MKDRRHATPLKVSLLAIGLLAATACLYWFQPNRGSLADFEHARSFRIPGALRNLSGITFNPQSGTLFLVTNSPARIYEITLAGEVLRRIDLERFHDTEDIVFIEGQTMAVVEERADRIVLFQVFPDTKVVRYEDCRHMPVLSPQGVNNGLEGLAWDPVSRTFLVAKETDPRAVYALPLDGGKHPRELRGLHNLPWIGLGDYAGIYFDGIAGRVLLLSRTSGRIKDLSLDGQEKGSLNLRRSIPGIIRAEGLTMTPGGVLYVCSEPDRIDVFTRRGGTAARAGAAPHGGGRVDGTRRLSADRGPQGA